MSFITAQLGKIKVRADQKLFIEKNLTSYQARLETIKEYAMKLYEMSL